MIKVDKNVPAPTGHGRSKYPWEEMAVGDSFFVPGKTPESLGGSITRRKRYFGEKHVTRSVTEGGVTGIRIWRIA